MHTHSRENINSDIWVRFPVKLQRFSLWQKLKGFMRETLNTWSCWDVAALSKVSLRGYITRISLMAWFSPVILCESVSLLELVWGSGELGTTEVTSYSYIYCCGKQMAFCLPYFFFFFFLSIKEIPYGWTFLSWWAKLCLLTSQSLDFLDSSVSLLLPFRDQMLLIYHLKTIVPSPCWF